MFRSFFQFFFTPVSLRKVSRSGADLKGTPHTATIEFLKLPKADDAPSIGHHEARRPVASGNHREARRPVASGNHREARRPVASGNHRERVLSMSLAHAQMCSSRRCERLASIGIETIGDLARCHPGRVANHFAAKKKAVRVITQYRRAARLSASVPGLSPRDAMLLVSIHRRSIRGLAMESPGQLQRDLERFAESSKGQSQLRGRRLPSLRRIKRWIAESEAVRSSSLNRSAVHTRAA